MKTEPALMIICLMLMLFACQHKPGYDQSVDVNLYFTKLGDLPDHIDESSGLSLLNNQLWTHNDSGDDPVLYQLDPGSGTYLNQVFVAGAGNVDWEDLTRDENYFYLGDFGNNSGIRQDLTIYRLATGNFDANLDTIAVSGKIEFSFEDQNRFDFDFNKHNFDCEAMIESGENLYLFSKNHVDKQCRLYQLSKQDETAKARLKGTFDVDGKISGADYSEADCILVLLGYNYNDWTSFRPFVWLFSEFEGDNFFDGKQQRIDLPIRVQTEGIVLDTQGMVLISSEAENRGKGHLFQLDINKWLE